jgi:NADPH-dependent 2,4-dienoyl-CoA reductase/sulfur reductase-like enzyme
VPEVVTAAGLAEPGAWVKVDPATLETRFPGVYAIGDVTVIPLASGMPLPKAGVFAHAQGEVVAARIADGLAGRTPTATFDGNGMCFRDRPRPAAMVAATTPRRRASRLPRRPRSTAASTPSSPTGCTPTGSLGPPFGYPRPDAGHDPS